MFIAFLLLFLELISIWVNGTVTKTVTYHADITTEFYNKFIKTVYTEDTDNFDIEETKKGKRYIIHSESPIEFQKYKYYWNDTHLDLNGLTNICEYRISWMIDSKELEQTYSAEGIQMKSLYYHCHFAQSCMGLECRVDSRLLVPPIFLTIFITIFWCFKKMLWRDMKREERIQRATIENTLNPQQMEAGPPSYAAVFSRVPPSYESVMLAKITYTVPSYS
ncbi:hypothetical protein CAEBREN_32360 [Caenorhabditis brenneri]|uniref:CX domain-containing protein n=1 Tax=Caenorhabditis brenneri TaxID=135651 RepID=G0P9Q2_CAEBE|nr:hypothetical protein CAEBREN_32360 [Caenorhabditis brenneri]